VKRILFQLDADRLPSAFDRVVGYDGGADHVVSYGGVEEGDVQGLVHGAIFTRGPKDLAHTAIFIGGSDVGRAERLLEAVREAFFGPFRVSVMLDPNGSNTTAAAAVVKLVRAIGGEVAGRRAVVLGGTGPVGSRAAGLLARLGARVAITSRVAERAREAARRVLERFGAEVEPVPVSGAAEVGRVLEGAELVLAAGSAGVRLLPETAWVGCRGLRAVADVNAVPPLGIEGVEATDDGEERGGVAAFGALAIGGLKMKVHKAAIADLFRSNDRILDAEAIYDLAATI